MSSSLHVCTPQSVCDEFFARLTSVRPGKKIMVRDKDTVRFLLGVPGAKPLVVFGVNPSTASDTDTDGELMAEKVKGFFSHIKILNLYNISNLKEVYKTLVPREQKRTH